MAETSNQKLPLRVAALDSSSSNAATFIFLHGFGDDAEGWINVAHQFQSASKLPHLSWVFPNAPHNHEAMSTAWYTPSDFSPIPVGRSSDQTSNQGNGSLDEDAGDEEFEDEIWKSVDYVEGLIEREIEKGIPVNRIILGGFSQGAAISLVTGVAGKFKGQLAGVVALSGYLPRGKRVFEGREAYVKERKTEEGGMRVFMAHGTRDMLLPMRVFRDAKARVERTAGKEQVDAHVYEGLGHVTSGVELRDMCGFLGTIVPA